MKNLLETPDFTSSFDSSDIESNKILSLFSYLGILFLIPLLAAKDSKYAKFHANQGLLLFICSIALNLVVGIISGIFGFIAGIIAGLLDMQFIVIIVTLLSSVVGFVVSAIIIAMMIFGIVNALTGKARELPLIGKFRIIK